MPKSNFGTLFEIGSGASAPYTYTALAGVFLVPSLEANQEKIEVTHHDQQSRYRKYIPSGLIDPGDDLPVQARSMPTEATQQTMYSLYQSNAIGHFRITHPDGFYQAFDGYVSGITYNEADATSPEAVNITYGIAIGGDVTEGFLDDSL